MTDNFEDHMADNFEGHFGEFISALASDPQFAAQGVMVDSLAGVLSQMDETQQVAVQKLIAQFARALNDAGMLTEQKVQ